MTRIMMGIGILSVILCAGAWAAEMPCLPQPVATGGVEATLVPLESHAGSGTMTMTARLRLTNRLQCGVTGVNARGYASGGASIEPASAFVERIAAGAQVFAQGTFSVTVPAGGQETSDKRGRLNWKVTYTAGAAETARAKVSDEPLPGGTIHVTVRDQKGSEITAFRYRADASPAIQWSPTVMLRSGDSDPFNADMSLFSGPVYEPHSYAEVTPRIFVEVYDAGVLVDSGYLDERDTFTVDKPGRYYVRCSTTFQVDGITQVEETGVLVGKGTPLPAWQEGCDGCGRYEFYKVEETTSAGQVAFRYYKRYTYNVVGSTMTHVAPEEADEAFVVMPRGPDVLGALAAGQSGVDWAAYTGGGELVNSVVMEAVSEGIKWSFRQGDVLVGAGGNLFGTPCGNVIYAGTTAEADLQLGELSASGLELGPYYAFGLRAGAYSGGTQYVTAMAVAEEALEYAWGYYCPDVLAPLAAIASADDLATENERKAPDLLVVHIKDSGAPIYNLKLAALQSGTVCGRDEWGVAQELDAGAAYSFLSVPETWLEGTPYGEPYVMFDVDILAKYGRPTVPRQYRLLPGMMMRAVDIVICMDCTGSMGGVIDETKAAAEDIVRKILDSAVARVAVVAYRDFPVSPYGGAGDYPYKDVVSFSSDEADIVRGINTLGAGGGADWPESVYSALMHSIDGSSLGGWCSGARRFIILLGDAPPHDPEPFTGYTLNEVITAACGSGPWEKVGIFAVPIGGEPTATSFFQALADGTGGALIDALDSTQVVEAIMLAIETIVHTGDDTVAPLVASLAAVPSKVRERVDTEVAVTAVFDDTETGDSSIAQAEYFLGDDPGVGNGTPMTAADGAFANPVEAATCVIDSSSWNIGESYTIGVRAKDSAGNWSTVSTITYAPGQAYEIVDGVAPAAVTALGARHIGSEKRTITTDWNTTGGTRPSEAVKVIDLGCEDIVSGVKLTVGVKNLQFPGDFTIETSRSGSIWTPMGKAVSFKPPAASCLWQVEDRLCRYVRIRAKRVKDAKDGLYYVRVPSISVYTALTGSLVEAQWTATADDGTDALSGPASQYDIRYSNSPITDANFESCGRVANCPVPGTPGSTEKFKFCVGKLTELYVGIKVGDGAENWSPLRTVGPLHLPARGFVPAEPAERAQFAQDDPIPTFIFRMDLSASACSIAFSNSDAFPAVAYVGTGGTVFSTVHYSLKVDQRTWTPSQSQWTAIKKVSGGTGTVYWRLEGKHSMYGMVYGPVRRFFFDCGVVSNLHVRDAHYIGGEEAVWPDKAWSPVFEWTDQGSAEHLYSVDVSTNRRFAAGPTKKDVVLTLGKFGLFSCQYKPTDAEWKKIRTMAAGVYNMSDGYATLYWRVRARTPDKALECASAANKLYIDGGVWSVSDVDLKGAAPAVSWATTASGLVKFSVQFSVDDEFLPKSGPVVTVPKSGTVWPTYTLTAADMKLLTKMASKYATDELYYRIRAGDADKAFVAYSPTKTTRAP